VSGLVRQIIGVLIIVVILAAAWWLFSLAVAELGIPPLFRTVAIGVVLVILIVAGLKYLRDQA
jgi:hypothetical protein